MSLSDQNRALIERIIGLPLPENASQGREIMVTLGSLHRLLDAARVEGRPSPEGEEAHAQAVEPFLRLAREVINPANGDRPWHADSKDWMVVFSFAGQSITLGDLRRAAALSPPAPEPGYEAEPVAPWGYGWTYDSVGRAVVGKKVVTDTPEPTIFLSNVFAKGPIPLYASPVPVAISREEVAEEIWRRFAPSYEETFAECANRSEYLLAADSILQRLSNQQGGDR